MAVINGHYIHVVSEDMGRGVNATSHPVEEGLPLTDTVRPQPITLSLSGKIVDYGDVKAAEVISKIKSWQDSGSLISYSGRTVTSNMQIRSFDTSHPNTINGGAEFSMELVKVRIAKSAYTPKKASTTAQTTAAKKTLSASDIKVGTKVIFKGGGVYRSSTASKASATRGRSTCKCTIIAKATAPHRYHLISTDGGKVYGWCDFADIESVAATSTSGKTNAGTQQTKKTTETKVNSTDAESVILHNVKKGDTVYGIINKYRSEVTLNKGLTTDQVVSAIVKENPQAFSVPGNAKTLQVNTKLKITPLKTTHE